MINIIYTPGLSQVAHRCVIEISAEGHLQQRLAKRVSGNWEFSPTEYNSRLDTFQISELQQSIAAIDFERLAARLTKALGSSHLSIEWYPLEGSSKKVEGRILAYDRGYHDFHQTFEPAQRLWKLVYEHLPNKFMD